MLNKQPGALKNNSFLRQIKAKIPSTKQAFFPRNTGNLFPSNIYSQITIWFRLMTTKDKTPAEIRSLGDF